MIGKIIKLTGGFYYVKDDKVYETRARGLFRHKDEKPVVGDIVDFEVEKEMLGYITNVHPRKNMLKRPPVANVDLALVIIPTKNPNPNIFLIDKVLAEYEKEDMTVKIVISKADLDKDYANKLKNIYEKAGYETYIYSAITGEGKESIKNLLEGKTTALSGVSAAGKSTLISNILNINLETGTVSSKLNRGKHTTRHVEIFPGENNTFIFDTPGFSSYEVDVEAEDLKYYFREFNKYSCKFNDCHHVNEPGCGVKAALENGEVEETRYESYIRLYEELKNRRKY
ncbi:ribosome small subunit-dependent GTPase A [Peptoniphilus duerdenii ATCC BAA-1640]|uniref:Small ribosomal subunit biogenesis GTPase RsgA n=1 Tax=Peptoniphilus duerdenii ATCC BAA-1640 TaxID=862517 RepID=E0NP15_9FIRM|nr:ribosome small subunit-dependent GTPase A [Peptoniphilus duerdenii]EFM24483.1 ribosome small subunit-dependent GTPase A [Peptoniphilus duerdenii ATCC BAA-1640]